MVLSYEVTPNMLLKDPTLLLHEKDFDGPLSSTDGLIGAVMLDGKWIVSSPNSTVAFEPPIGGDRALYLRSNLRFGDDDPLQWPQPFTEEYPHLGCIMLRPKQEDHPLRILWWWPDRHHFRPNDHSTLLGVGKLDPAWFLCLQGVSLTLLKRAHDSQSTVKSISQLCITLENLLHRLEFIPTNFRTMQLSVREAQRVFLEITAYLDYLEIYEGNLDGSRLSSHGRRCQIMGAFTHDLDACDRLFRAGIPVWLVRPCRDLPSMRIKMVVPLQAAESILPLGLPPLPPHPSIYRGPGGSPQKFLAITQHAYNFLKLPNPFVSTRAILRADAPPPAEPSKRELRRQHYTPYSNKPKKLGAPAPDRDKFTDPHSPILPPAIPTWQEALRNVKDSNLEFALQEQIPTDLGYVFPEPALFVSTQSSIRQDMYFRGWLKYRDALLYRLSSDFNAAPMPNTVWRKLLAFELDNNQDKKDVGASKSTRAAKQRDLVNDFLQDCLKAPGVAFAESEVGQLSWNGKVVGNPSNLEREEILWELAELNFRFELLALDSRASSKVDNDRYKLVGECFPGCASGISLLVADLGAANHGLASTDWEERSQYLMALKRLMMTWRGDIPSIILVKKYKWKEQDIRDLEDAITSFYTQSFYRFFRRAAIVPRRLSHTASLYRIQVAPGKIMVLDPAPNTFYDTSIILPLM